MAQQKFDVYQDVTNQIIEALEEGVQPWRCPWEGGSGGGMPLRHNAEPYRGINSVLLTLRGWQRGYVNPVWMTFRQAKELGGMVRKGETSSLVVKYGTFETKQEAEQGASETQQTRGYLKAYRVFNIDQIDGLEDRFPTPDKSEPFNTRPIEQLSHIASEMIEGMGVSYREGGNRAFYAPSTDEVCMPKIDRFPKAQDFYSVLFHELVHATGLKSRCDRTKEKQGSRFGNATYAKEELVAEIGSAFLGSQLGFEPHHIEDSAAYIASWLEVLRNDKRLIVRQAAAAQRAVDYLLSLTTAHGQQQEAA